MQNISFSEVCDLSAVLQETASYKAKSHDLATASARYSSNGGSIQKIYASQTSRVVVQGSNCKRNHNWWIIWNEMQSKDGENCGAGGQPVCGKVHCSQILSRVGKPLHHHHPGPLSPFKPWLVGDQDVPRSHPRRQASPSRSAPNWHCVNPV